MIRRSTIKLENPNTGKKQILDDLFQESLRVINLYIDELWVKEDFSSKFVSFKVGTWLTARMQQCLGKQALEIVKSQRKRKRKTKPILKNQSIILDSRFVQFLGTTNSFDFWVSLSSFKRKIRLLLPGRRHRHYNQFSDWTRKSSIRLRRSKGQYFIDIFFQKDFQQSSGSQKLGVDTGWNHLIAVSDERLIGSGIKHKCEKIARKQRGSNRYKRSLIERTHYINQQLKLIVSNNIHLIVAEDLKKLKHKPKFSTKFMNKFQYWTYFQLLSRLSQLCEVVGVQYHKVNPAYTSQTCSKCNHVDKKSRNGEMFVCTSCSYRGHADINASRNILIRFLRRENIDPDKTCNDVMLCR